MSVFMSVTHCTRETKTQIPEPDLCQTSVTTMAASRNAQNTDSDVPHSRNEEKQFLRPRKSIMKLFFSVRGKHRHLQITVGGMRASETTSGRILDTTEVQTSVLAVLFLICHVSMSCRELDENK